MRKKIANLKEEYNEIYIKIEEIDKYKELNSSIHHGISRKEHINRVGFLSFLMAKLFKMDIITATRGALLHDFFTDKDIEAYTKKQWHKIHPYIALNNSMDYFELNKKEKNIIESHMFPLNRELPRYKESVLVGCVDKAVSVYELFRFNVKSYAYFMVLFVSTKFFS